MTPDVVRMKAISMSFAGNLVLNDVDFNVRDGELHSLVGANGAGKSTLIKILNGVYRMSRGSIEINGERVNIDNPKAAERFGMAFVHQELNICPDMTVAENIFMGNWPMDKYGRYDRNLTNRKAMQLSATMGIDLDPAIAVRHLRTAEKQTVEILKALTRNANILVLDEPTSSLTEHEKEKFFGIIEKCKQNGISIIFISHFLEDVIQISDRVTVLKDGRVNGVFARGGYTKDDLVHAMMGVSVRNTEFIPLPKARSVREVLRVRELSSHGKFHDISLAVHSGDIVGICGLLGAGKTEIARAIFGLDPIDSGAIYVDGSLVESCNPSNMIDRGVVLLTEERKTEGFVPLLSIRENTTLSIGGMFQNLGTLNRTAQTAFAQDIATKMMVKMTSVEQPVFSLSGGNQQKVVLAKCLSIEPKLFLLDEPTRGVDIMAKSEIYKILREFVERGTAIIIFSSEIEELLGNCSKIYVLKKGSMIDHIDSLAISKNDLLSMIS